MAKKDKKKGKAKQGQAAQPPAWFQQVLGLINAPIMREIVAAGLIAAAGVISKNPQVREGVRRGAGKARELAHEAAHEVEELGTAVKQMAEEEVAPRVAPRRKKQKRNGGAPARAH